MNSKKISTGLNSFKLFISLIPPDLDGVDELYGVDEDVDAVDDEEDERRKPKTVVVDENSGHGRSNKVAQEETGRPHALKHSN
jgi:hypothetical protein